MPIRTDVRQGFTRTATAIRPAAASGRRAAAYAQSRQALPRFLIGASAAALIFILLAGVSARTAGAVLQPAYIQGALVNAFSGDSIRIATITTTSGLVTSTSNGRFSFRLPPGVYDIIVTAPGFISNMIIGVVASPGKTTDVALWLFPASSAAGLLEGRVVASQTGAGVSGAFVITDLGGIAVTDASGAFRMPVPAGIAQLRVFGTGYATTTVPGVPIQPDRPRAVYIALRPAPQSQTTVTGIVRNACTTSKLSEARIASSSGDFALSNQGYYRIAAPGGITTLLITAEAYQFAAHTFNAGPVPVAAVYNPLLYPSRNGCGRIAGVITDALDSAPVAGVRVASDTGWISYSRHDGSYDLYPSVCTSTVVFSRQGYQDLQVPLSVSSGRTVSLSVMLDPLASITGTVRDAAYHHALRGCRVFLEELPDLPAIVMDDGTYSLVNIPAGRYTLSAAHPCYGPAGLMIDIAAGESRIQDLQLEADAYGVIEGHVTDRIAGEPVDGARIQADTGPVAASGPAGRYRLNAPACDTAICVSAAGYLSQTIASIAVPDSAAARVDVELVPCPVALLLSDPSVPAAHDRTALIRQVRDATGAAGPSLRRHIQRYYVHAAELSALLADDPRFAASMAQFAAAVLQVYSAQRFFAPVLMPPEDLLLHARALIEQMIERSRSEDVRRYLKELREECTLDALGDLLNRIPSAPE